MSRPRSRRRTATAPRQASIRNRRPAGSASTRRAPVPRRWAARRRAAVVWSGALLVLAGLITAALVATSAGSGTAQSSTVRRAPALTLPSTAGRIVSLASYRGHDVVLYFNEGLAAMPASIRCVSSSSSTLPPSPGPASLSCPS